MWVWRFGVSIQVDLLSSPLSRVERERALFIESPDGQLHAYQTPADATSSLLMLGSLFAATAFKFSTGEH